MAQVPYRITVHNIEGCNCTTGCNCQFGGLPDKGGCEMLIGGEVSDGEYGDVSLKGVRYIVAAMYPKAIHEGNGKVAVFIDEKATQPQADAIATILSGQAGGMPWEALAGTIAVLDGPVRKPIEMTVKGTRSAFRIPGVLEMRQTPILDSVSGKEKEVQIVYPKGGFFWNTGDIATTNVLEASYGAVKFRHGGGFASYSTPTWTNQH
ncbi:MAG: DUF1326 domain-containing protein [Gemmatimonadales bacterium]